MARDWATSRPRTKYGRIGWVLLSPTLFLVGCLTFFLNNLGGSVILAALITAIPSLVALVRLISPPDVCAYCDGQTKVGEVDRQMIAQTQSYGTERVYIREGTHQANSYDNAQSNYTRSYPTLAELHRVTNMCPLCGGQTVYQQQVTRRIG
jgi:hypothetical protein